MTLTSNCLEAIINEFSNMKKNSLDSNVIKSHAAGEKRYGNLTFSRWRMMAILDFKVMVPINVQGKVRNGFLALKLAGKDSSFVFPGPLLTKIYFRCGPWRPY